MRGGILELITDRTQSDVDRILEIISKYNSGEITEEEAAEYLSDSKGTYKFTDFNRVVSALNYINDRLRESGYNRTIKSKSNWKMSDYITPEEFNTYLSDVETIRSTLAVLSSTPQTPTGNFDFEKANDIEKILLDVDFLITKTMNNWIYSGEVASGEV